MHWVQITSWPVIEYVPAGHRLQSPGCGSGKHPAPGALQKPSPLDLLYFTTTFPSFSFSLDLALRVMIFLLTKVLLILASPFHI
jgi:hypothetical protein